MTPRHYRHECACGEVVAFDYQVAVSCRPTWTCRGCGTHVQTEVLTPSPSPTD